jgi:hypothetical protein
MTTPARLWPWLTALLLALASGCTRPEDPGTHLPVGPSNVYYTGGVTAAQAERAVRVLAREVRIDVTPCLVQLRCRDRRYEVRFAMRPGAEWTTSARSARSLGEKLSTECFGGSPVDVHLCDEQMTTLRVIPFEPIRPDLPVRVTVRPSAAGGSLVAQYRNDSGKHLALRVRLRNPTLNQSQEVVVNIPPYGVTEHGWAEGWSYRSGERVTVSHADYETADLVVP